MKYSPVFNHKPTKIEFLDERKIGMARTPYFYMNQSYSKKMLRTNGSSTKKNKKFLKCLLQKNGKKFQTQIGQIKFPNGIGMILARDLELCSDKDFTLIVATEDDINKFNYIFNLNKKLIKSFDKTIKISEEKFKTD